MGVRKIKSGYLPFVQKELTAAPFTSIQNRVGVDSSLKVIMGNERVHVNSLNKLSKELGPNGEPVFESDKGDSRIRFVGPRWVSRYNQHGLYAYANNTDGTDKDSIEVTFYGTAINILMLHDSGSREVTVGVDGGAQGSNLYPSGGSGVVNARNSKQNKVLPIVKDLSLDWHTVNIKINPGTTADFYFYGFEIINQSSQLTVKSGKAHGNGYEYLLESDTLIDYKTGFDNIADIDVGVKGGRAVVYLDPATGEVKKRFTKVDATAQYLSSANHLNEAPYRVVNFREFGRELSDDFSTLSTTSSARAFTLDDGSTTLVGNAISVSGSDERLDFNANGDFITFHFTGSGFAIDRLDTANGGADDYEVFVDGVSIGNLNSSGDTTRRITDIVSGLPYTSHTVKIIRNSASTWALQIYNFILYQPKKPSLPEGAIEKADYNIVADFVANTVAGLDTISTGIIRKHSTREWLFTGSWDAVPLGTTSFIGGQAVSAETTLSGNENFEYTFFGTGFDFRYLSNTDRPTSVRFSINGTLLTAANFPTAIFEQYGNGSYDDSTALLNPNAALQQGNGLAVSGLPLDEYTIKVESLTSGAGFWTVEVLDIITPIHSPHTTFGSLSLRDVRNFDSTKDVNKIAKVAEDVFASVSQDDALVYRSKGVSQVLHTTTGNDYVYVEEPYTNIPAIIGSARRGAKIFSTAETVSKKHLARIQMFTPAGSNEDAPYDVKLIGVKEKDELEE